MDTRLQSTFGSASEVVVTRHRVLRNTYWLLALSMIPTVLGAWLGVRMNFTMFAGSPMIGMVAFLAIAFGFFYAIEKTKHSAAGVGVLLAFTFFMGLMLSRLISHTLGYSNGGTLIMTAFGGTAAIFGVMATIATVSKRDFSGMGKFLFVGVLVILAAAVLNIFLQLPALQLVVSVLAIGIFPLTSCMTCSRSSTAARPITSPPRSASTSTSTTSSPTCFRCWEFLAVAATEQIRG